MKRTCMYCGKSYEARRGFLCETCRKDRWYEERYPDFVIKLSKKNIERLAETGEIFFPKTTYWKHRFEKIATMVPLALDGGLRYQF